MSTINQSYTAIEISNLSYTSNKGNFPAVTPQDSFIFSQTRIHMYLKLEVKRPNTNRLRQIINNHRAQNSSQSKNPEKANVKKETYT